MGQGPGLVKDVLCVNARRGQELGKPFTQTDDDEEWTGWIDWGALGGGSGDVA